MGHNGFMASLSGRPNIHELACFLAAGVLNEGLLPYEAALNLDAVSVPFEPAEDEPQA
jgi:hypothetical protein